MNSLKTLLREHPIFTAADDIERLCQPLRQLGIFHFSHVRVNNNGTFSLLSKNPVFLQHYFDHSYYHFDVIQLSPCTSEQYLIRDLQSLTGNTKKLQQAFNAHGFGHSFTISKKSDTHIDFYNFGTHLGNTAINEQYLLKLDQLKQFICYFHDKVNTHKGLSKAYDYQVGLKSLGSGFKLTTEFAEAFHLDRMQRVYIPGQKTFLTLREFECLNWLAKGKTQEQIAEILNISLRTVKAHVIHVREKLHCVNQFQLGMIFAQIPQSLNQFQEFPEGDGCK